MLLLTLEFVEFILELEQWVEYIKQKLVPQQFVLLVQLQLAKFVVESILELPVCIVSFG